MEEKLILILPAVLVFLWIILAGALLVWSKKSVLQRKVNLAQYFGYNKVSSEAKDLGWNISTKEFLAIVVFAVAIGIILSAIFRNPLIIVAGIMAGFYLPRFLIQRYKKHQRMELMVAIPDFGRILIARLVDHHSIVKAFEVAQNDTTGLMKTLAEGFVKDVGVGIGVQPALENLKNKVAFRKFNTFVETLLIAHQEGYSSEALRAMEKAMEAIENDVNAIEALDISSKKKKRELIYVILAAWAFPIILSFMNTDNANIYMDTLVGKILMFSYIVTTIVVLIKGEDYLSLKLEEL